MLMFFLCVPCCARLRRAVNVFFMCTNVSYECNRLENAASRRFPIVFCSFLYCFVCAAIVLVFNLAHLSIVYLHSNAPATYILLPVLQLISCVFKISFHPQKYAVSGKSADEYIETTYNKQSFGCGLIECVTTRKLADLGTPLIDPTALSDHDKF